MKFLEYKQAKIVSSVDEYNKAMRELADKNPEEKIDFSGGHFHALIIYTVKEEIPESVRDEFHLRGIRHGCRECPLHDPVEDHRKRYVPCKYAEGGEADLKGDGCEMMYRKLAQGDLKMED